MKGRRGYKRSLTQNLRQRCYPALSRRSVAASSSAEISSVVMNALARLPPAQGIAAMQSINITVVNPSFFGVFFGTAVLCLYLAGRSLFSWNQPGAPLVFAASLLYILGTIVVTIALNVPLNDALAAAALFTTALLQRTPQ
jgi:uncharacterized membrane protein